MTEQKVEQLVKLVALAICIAADGVKEAHKDSDEKELDATWDINEKLVVRLSSDVLRHILREKG